MDEKIYTRWLVIGSLLVVCDGDEYVGGVYVLEGPVKGLLIGGDIILDAT